MGPIAGDASVWFAQWDWSAIATLIVGVLAVAGTIFGLWYGKKSEREAVRIQREADAAAEQRRWAREDRQRLEEWQRADEQRWTDELRKASLRFLHWIDELWEVSRGEYDDRARNQSWEKAWDGAYEEATHITLIAPELEDAANATYDEARKLLQASARWNRDSPPAFHPPPLDDREKPAADAYEAFMNAVTKLLRPGWRPKADNETAHVDAASNLRPEPDSSQSDSVPPPATSR